MSSGSGFGPDARVVAPPDVVAAARTLAQQIVSAHGTPNGAKPHQ